MRTPRRSVAPNDALYNARDARAETQQDVAEALTALAYRNGQAVPVTANQVSRWERGSRPSPLYRRLLAEHFGCSVADLGLTRPRQREDRRRVLVGAGAMAAEVTR